MKLDAILARAVGKSDAGKKLGKPMPGFEAALTARAQPGKEAPAERPARDDKKPRQSSVGAEEALWMARALVPQARTALIVTKPAEQKAQPAKIAEQVSSRARGQQEHVRVSGPTETKKPTRVAEVVDELKDHPKLADAPTKANAAALLPKAEVEAFRVGAADVITQAAPLAPVAPLMLDDASLRAVLLPNIARMTLDAGDAGRLNVQVKIHDGITDIRAAGPAAQLLEARQGELRIALAHEGLAMGHFDLTQSGSQERPERPEFDEGAPSAPRATASPTPEAVTDEGRVHVKV